MARPKSPLRLEWVDPVVCSLDYRLKIVGRLPFFKHLPAEAVSKINAGFHDRDVVTDEKIYHEGDEAGYIYLVAIGKVKLVRNTGGGREVLLDILRGGEYFGTMTSFGSRLYAETAIAQTDGCILQISQFEFENILTTYPDVTRKVLEVVSRRLEESQEVVKQLSSYSAEQRVAAALLRLAGKMGEARGQGVLIQLPFSRQDLADMTGTTPETVSRVVSRLDAAGIIKAGRKWVTILDPDRLKDLPGKGAVI